MSWVRDVEGDLINLDHVKVIMLADEDDGSDAEIIASVDDETAYTLFIGSGIEAERVLGTIWSKLPKVQP